MSDLAVYIKLGWRNLGLHPLRTGLTVSALALGIAALAFLAAMNDGWLQQIKTNFALTLTGHIQIHAAGFESSRRLADRIRKPAAVEKVLAAERAVATWSRRVRVSGLASTAAGSAGVSVLGLQPGRERRLSRLAHFLKRGRWLKPGDERAIVLGSGLAARLQADLGDKVVLMAALDNGDIASEVFRVRGILHSGVLDIDDFLAAAPLARVQRWLDLGEGVTDIVIRARSFRDVDALAAGLRRKLRGRGLEVLTWSEIDPMAEQWSRFADAYAWIILAVVILVVLAEVLNTMLMSLHERTREFGLMAALGARPGQIFAMVVWETLLLVALGGLVGSFIGVWLAGYFGRVGIDLSRFAAAFSFMYMDPVVHPALKPESLLQILAAALFGSLLSSLPPAWKAARLDPAQAMRVI